MQWLLNAFIGAKSNWKNNQIKVNSELDDSELDNSGRCMRAYTYTHMQINPVFQWTAFIYL